MKTLLANFQLFVTIGIIVIMYFWLMSWSLGWFVCFRKTYSSRKHSMEMNKGCVGENVAKWLIEKYDWKEIVAIPVYILTWTPLLAIGVAFIGGFFYLLYLLFSSMITMTF